MEKLQEHLCKIADKLDQEGKFSAADIITKVIEKKSLVKIAQYCGASGYALTQNRALANCFRRKRAKKSKQSIQETVFECLSEYQDSTKFYETDWAKKYAQVASENPHNAHVVLMESISETNSISEHVEDLRKCAEIINDETIKKVLSHYDLVQSFLQKDAERSADNSPFLK